MGMIVVRCPNCSADIQLDDSREFGFCNFCGTKVMQDKIVVEHRGSVKVDQSEFIQKSIANGRRALEKEDWEEVEKYYNLVEQNVPDNIEAVFFSSYGKAMLSMTDGDYYKREQKFQVLTNSMSAISDYFETTSEDKEEVLKRIDKYIDKMLNVPVVYKTGVYGMTTGSGLWCKSLVNSVRKAFVAELSQISEKHNDNYILVLLNKNKAEDVKSSNDAEKNKKRTKWGYAIIIICAVISFIAFLIPRL